MHSESGPQLRELIGKSNVEPMLVNVIRLLCVGCLAILASPPICFAQSIDTAGETSAVEEMYQELHSCLARMESIEYEAGLVARTFDVPIPGLEPGVRRQQLMFIMQADKFRSGVETTNADGEPTSWEYTFDGDRYQRFQDGLLSVTGEPRERLASQYDSEQPIVVPFGFAFGEGDAVEYSTLLEESLWEELASRTTYLGADEVGGTACEKVLVTQPKFGAEFNFTVCLDPDLCFYPIHWDLEISGAAPPSGRMFTSTSVETLAHETDAGRVVVPTHVKTDMLDSERSLVRSTEIAIDPETLRVNEPIDASVFTIDELSAAAGILDEDTETLRMPMEQQSAPVQRTLWILAFLIAAGVVVAGVYWYRRRHGGVR